jgi:hypothetical protein
MSSPEVTSGTTSTTPAARICCRAGESSSSEAMSTAPDAPWKKDRMGSLGAMSNPGAAIGGAPSGPTVTAATGSRRRRNPRRGAVDGGSPAVVSMRSGASSAGTPTDSRSAEFAMPPPGCRTVGDNLVASRGRGTETTTGLRTGTPFRTASPPLLRSVATSHPSVPTALRRTRRPAVPRLPWGGASPVAARDPARPA